jgi:hypothetical protein
LVVFNESFILRLKKKFKIYYVMKRIFWLSFVLCMTLSSTLAQESAQPLESKTDFWRGLHVQQGEQKMTLKEAESLMSNVAEAQEWMKKARSDNGVATFMGFASGFLIGTSIGQEINPNRDANWIFAGVGGVLLIATIPISNGAKKKVEKAVAIYNETQGLAKSSRFNPDMRMKISGQGIGFQVSF